MTEMERPPPLLERPDLARRLKATIPAALPLDQEPSYGNHQSSNQRERRRPPLQPMIRPRRCRGVSPPLTQMTMMTRMVVSEGAAPMMTTSIVPKDGEVTNAEGGLEDPLQRAADVARAVEEASLVECPPRQVHANQYLTNQYPYRLRSKSLTGVSRPLRTL